MNNCIGAVLCFCFLWFFVFFLVFFFSFFLYIKHVQCASVSCYSIKSLFINFLFLHFIHVHANRCQGVEMIQHRRLCLEEKKTKEKSPFCVWTIHSSGIFDLHYTLPVIPIGIIFAPRWNKMFFTFTSLSIWKHLKTALTGRKRPMKWLIWSISNLPLWPIVAMVCVHRFDFD